MSKVFLSYSSEDEDFVKGFYKKLKTDGVDCWFDRESISWGANWVVELEKGLDEYEFIVLILSLVIVKLPSSSGLILTNVKKGALKVGFIHFLRILLFVCL